MTIGAGETILAADIQSIKDDVDKLTDMATDTVNTAETTTSTSYTDLATAGPSVTVTTGTLALVLWSAQLSNDTAGQIGKVGVAVSGATTISATDNFALVFESNAADDLFQGGMVRFVNLTAGSNTFTLKYSTTSGTETFRRRNIVVLPIGA